MAVIDSGVELLRPLPKADMIASGLCLYFVILALLYAAVTPPFEAPDEASHFLYIHNILQTRQLPVLEDRAAMFSSQSVQRHHPPLYYLIGAVLVSWTKRDDAAAYLHPNPFASIGVVADNNQNVYLHPIPSPNGDTLTAIRVLRLYSILLATGTVWLIYRSGRLITGKSHTGLLAALLVISIPTFVHISASINNDNLVTLLHAAGIYLCLRMWQQQRISAWDMVLASILLSAVALTKINGLTLFGIVYGWTLFGALTRRFQWRQVGSLIILSLIVTALAAGWWYWRNIQLYGDPLALNATLRIWGRGGGPHIISLFEAKGIWDSFWFTLGHFNVRGPDWLYDMYLPIAAVLALIGLIYAGRRIPKIRLRLSFLLLVGVLAVAALVVSTSRINVSQGRILFPGMAAFVLLLVIGWHTLLGRKAGLMIVPLAGLALVTPFIYLAPAFAPARIIGTLPAAAKPVGVYADQLGLLGYELLTDTVQPDRWVRMNLFITGATPDNLHLFVKAINPLNGSVLGGVDEFPGMMPTTTMKTDAIYAIPIRFRLDTQALSGNPGPYQIQLAFGWRRLDTNQTGAGRRLPLADENGVVIDNLLLGGPTWLNHDSPPAPQFSANIVFDNRIRLSGYSLSTEQLQPGDSLFVTLNWQYAAPLNEDWTTAIGLLDENEQPVTVADGGVPGYPTAAWRAGPAFADSRVLTIPADAVPGRYRLYVGWYRLSDGMRLQPEGENVDGNLFIHPSPILICTESPCDG